MTLWGYARVSKVDQNPAAQFAALAAAGVDEAHIVTDHASGSKEDRPGLARVLDELAAGDVLVVWKLDRLGRSVSDLMRVVEDLGARGVQFKSLTEGLDTTTSQGRMVFQVCTAAAQCERSLAQERTAMTLARARATARPLGRPSRVTEQQWRLAHQMQAAGRSQREIASTIGLSRAVVGRVLRGEVASLGKRFGALAPDDGTLRFYEPKGDGA